MKPMDNFSFTRVGMLLKRDFMENKRSYLFKCVALYGLLMFFVYGSLLDNGEVIMTFTSDKPNAFVGDPTGFNALSVVITVFAVLVFIILGHYAASTILKPLRSKETSLSYLLLPASPAEKYFSRLLQVTLGTLLVFVVATQLVSLTYWLMLPLFDKPETYHIWLFGTGNRLLFPHFQAEMGAGVSASRTAVVWLGWFTSYLFSTSCYVLGGSFWKKHPFAKTLIAIFVLSLFFGVVDVAWYTSTPFILRSSLVFVLLTLLNWWLGYCLFRRKQVSSLS